MSAADSRERATPVTYEVETTIRVRITVGDPEYVLRCVDNIDGWRDKLYDLEEPDDVFRHLAFNAVFNEVADARRLDGWADLERGALTMAVERGVVDVYVTPRFERPSDGAT